ncbi:MAG: hypothetical protein IKU84_00695 [Clostridia bacterium]|nr:hypothetical protein [Clostridia bacterium]
MKKFFYLIPTAAVLGLFASWARGYELAFGFDMISGLPVSGAWIAWLLMAVAALIGVCVFFMLGKKVPEARDAKKSPVYTGVSLFAAAVMLGHAGYVFFTNQIVGETILYLFAALSVLNAISFALIGVKNLIANDNPIYSVFTFVQVLWATLAVILVFRERVSEPIAEHFIFLLFAFLCILMFAYAQTGYVFGRNRFAVAAVTGVVGVYLALIEIIAPFIASAYNVEYYLSLDFKIFLPLVAYVFYMPVAVLKILRNENDVK